jgi:hypothetical protein
LAVAATLIINHETRAAREISSPRWRGAHIETREEFMAKRLMKYSRDELQALNGEVRTVALSPETAEAKLAALRKAIAAKKLAGKPTIDL